MVNEVVKDLIDLAEKYDNLAAECYDCIARGMDRSFFTEMAKKWERWAEDVRMESRRIWGWYIA